MSSAPSPPPYRRLCAPSPAQHGAPPHPAARCACLTARRPGVGPFGSSQPAAALRHRPRRQHGVADCVAAQLLPVHGRGHHANVQRLRIAGGGADQGRGRQLLLRARTVSRWHPHCAHPRGLPGGGGGRLHRRDARHHDGGGALSVHEDLL
eukprot:scaffold596_cov378-Prasinococcus_capsulatus_cf.AAC.5